MNDSGEKGYKLTEQIMFNSWLYILDCIGNVNTISKYNKQKKIAFFTDTKRWMLSSL